MNPADVIQFLAGLRLFGGFTGAQLAELGARVRVHELTRGQVLFYEGERGETMFFVRDGTLVISKEVKGRVENVLARMGPGDFFGEMNLFGRSQRSATAQAESDAVVVALDRETLAHSLEMAPRAAMTFLAGMVEEFSRRLGRTDDLVAEVTRWGLEATGLDREVDTG